jgi:hypothetical protein
MGLKSKLDQQTWVPPAVTALPIAPSDIVAACNG